jgi:WD40 repeat protein
MEHPIRIRVLCLTAWALPLLQSVGWTDEPNIRFEREIEMEGQGSPRPVITTVCRQPTGFLIAAAGDDHIVRIWDSRSGRLEHRLKGHSDWVRCSAFAPDGNTLVTAGDDGRILFWNPVSGELLQALSDDIQPIRSISIAPDGQTVAAVGFGPYICLYDIANRRLRQRWFGPGDDLRVAMFSPEGTHVAVGGRNGTIRLIDIQSPEKPRDLMAHRQRVRALSFISDKPWLVSAGEDRMIHVWNWKTGAKEFSLNAGTQKIHAVVSLQTAYMASGGSDNEIRIWDLNQQKEIERLSGHTGTVAALTFANESLFSGGFDTTLREWRVGPGK